MKSKSRLVAVLAFGIAALLLCVLLYMGRSDYASHKPEFGLATFLIVGFLLLASVSIGVSLLIRLQSATDSTAPASFEHYRHVLRLAVVLSAVVGAAAIGRALLVPKTYGEFGYYRGASVADNMNVRKPVYQGMTVCEECHGEIVNAHGKDVHVNVQCENCHGPADRHVGVMTGEIKDATTLEIVVPKTQELCLYCHRRLAARPASFPQIDPREHYAMLEVSDDSTQCSACHSPHEPLFLDQKLSDARRHPTIYQCSNCHKEPMEENAPLPKTHIAVFKCGYCHGQLSADFAKRRHGKLSCGVCHQFYVESESAGRIVKHRDPRFCLLCHLDRPFVKSVHKPTIAWPDHRKDVSFGPADEKKVCVDCHREAFHLSFRSLGEVSKESH